jgi:hypothetical protein
MRDHIVIDPHHALALGCTALDLGAGDPQRAVALLVHALAGTLAMALPEARLQALQQDGTEAFAEVLAEALPVMAKLVAQVESHGLAEMRPEGQA